jgi:metal-responsive CopG/Arc/MetJ family transcriptional regulator
MKRATVYFDEDLHQALKLKALKADRSISDLVNDAVRGSLEEDRLDLEAIRNRSGEKTVSYESFLKELKSRGQI